MSDQQSRGEIERLRELDARMFASEEALDELRKEYGRIIEAAKVRFDNEDEWWSYLVHEVGFKRSRATAYRWMDLAKGKKKAPKPAAAARRDAPLQGEGALEYIERLAPSLPIQELEAARDALTREIARRAKAAS